MPLHLGLILYFGVASMVANAALVFTPLLISGMVNNYQFSEANAIFVIATELLASAFAAVPALWWVTKISWAKISRVSLLVVVLTNLLSTLLIDFEYMLVLRGVSGFFAGTLLILYMVVIATLPDTERVFSGKLVVQLIFSALGMAVLPFVITQFGVDAVYLLLAILGGGLIASRKSIPSHQYTLPTEMPEALPRHKTNRALRNNILILIALFLFAMGTNIIWSVLVPLGQYEGVSVADIGWVLSVATMLAVVGGTLSTLAGARFGRTAPIALGLLMGALGAILLMYSHVNVAYFLMGASLICIARVVTIPYLIGVMSVFNQLGRLAILSHVALASGMALGSFVVSLTITHLSLNWLPIIALFCILITALVVITLKYPAGSATTQAQAVNLKY